jgi:hypothetical protein
MEEVLARIGRSRERKETNTTQALRKRSMSNHHSNYQPSHVKRASSYAQVVRKEAERQKIFLSYSAEVKDLLRM